VNINDEIIDWREMIGLPEAARKGRMARESLSSKAGKFVAKSPFFADMRAKSDRLLAG
jgi:hypothetical protein